MSPPPCWGTNRLVPSSCYCSMAGISPVNVFSILMDSVSLSKGALGNPELSGKRSLQDEVPLFCTRPALSWTPLGLAVEERTLVIEVPPSSGVLGSPTSLQQGLCSAQRPSTAPAAARGKVTFLQACWKEVGRSHRGRSCKTMFLVSIAVFLF